MPTRTNKSPLLGVNIDHIATLRQARREEFPDPILAAEEAVHGGADGITAHLREDRRHIQDRDIFKLKESLTVPLNMEMSADPSVIKIAEQVRPAWICLVPEKRQELTTEGGLDLNRSAARLKEAASRLKARGTKISFFVEPDPQSVRFSREFGADAIEIHTGAYARAFHEGRSRVDAELDRILTTAKEAEGLGLLVNAGHGIDYRNVEALSRIFPFHEFNIGFSIVGRSVFVGMKQAVKEMKEKMSQICAVS